MSRDIKKDKENMGYFSILPESPPQIALYYIDRCEHLEIVSNHFGARCKLLVEQYEAAQARISELEAAALLHTRPDVQTLPWYSEECDWCGEDGYCQEVSKPDGMPGDMCASCLRKREKNDG